MSNSDSSSTIKTRIQMENTKLMATVKSIYKIDGPFGYYKGATGPLVSVPVINSIIFASYELTKKTLEIYQGKEYSSLFDIGVAGGVAGFFNTLIVTPIELVKCKIQMQKDPSQYKNSIDCLFKLVSKNGVRGLYQGNFITIIREISGNSAQFFSYEAAKKYIFGPAPIFFDYELRNSVRDRRRRETPGKLHLIIRGRSSRMESYGLRRHCWIPCLVFQLRG